MIDFKFLLAGIAIMGIIIIREILRKKCNFDMDKIDVNKSSKKWFRFAKKSLKKLDIIKTKNEIPNFLINKNTGNNSLTIIDSGENKAALMATIRQITDIDYESAKYIVNNVPCTFMTNISEDEANLTKKALEFIGARIEIK